MSKNQNESTSIDKETGGASEPEKPSPSSPANDLIKKPDLTVRLLPNQSVHPKHDGWDKVDILAKLLASVVIAGVGILLNSSIQRTQIASSEASNRAQIEIAKLKAQDDKKLQEGALTAQLVQHLASKDPTERELSIIALRESVPPPIYEAALLILARSDPSKDVRIRAIENLARNPTATATNALSRISEDKSRSTEERKVAEISAEKAAVGQFSTKDVTGTIVFAAASRGSAAMDGSSDLGHGVFTYFLLKGLGGEADTKRDGSIDLDEMEQYLRFNVTKYTDGSQIPFVTSEGYKLTSFPLNRSSTPAAKIFVLAIGVNSHSSPYFLRLQYPVLDAQGVADLYRSKFGASTTLLTDATRAQIIEALQGITQSMKPDDTLVIYYAGMGLLLEGKSMLVPFDARENDPSSFLSVDDLKIYLEKVGTRILYLDTCFNSSRLLRDR